MDIEKISSQLEKRYTMDLFGSLFDGSSTIFGIKDRDHCYLYVNQKLASLFGASAVDIIGKRADNFMPLQDVEGIHKRELEIMASGKALSTIEQVLMGDNLYTFAVTFFPFCDDKGNIIGSGFIGIDIQDRVWVNSNLHATLEKAQQTILELQNSVNEMKVQATTDPLTGIWNRLQIEVNARQEMAKRDRYDHDVALIFIDLDHFKRVNDTWGHTTGDSVLIEFCSVVKQCLRTSDLFGRWGGEEFVLLLPNTPLPSAQYVAERIRMALDEHTFDVIGRLTASFGVASYTTGESWPAWIERADDAVYRAKAKGRNRVETDEPISAIETSEVLHSGFLRLLWKETYECGNELIDFQHRMLFSHANDLLSAILAKKTKEEITTIINTLLGDVVQHFSDEEAIFFQTEFKDAEKHKKIHERLVKKAIRLANRFQKDKLDLGELFSFLAYDVIARHMLSDDKKFAPFLPQPEKTAKTDI